MDNHAHGCEGCGRDISDMRSTAKWCPSCAHEAKQGRQKRRCRDPNMGEKLAALILAHLKIPHDVAKSMTVQQILSLVQWDHYPVAVNAARDLGWTADQTNHPSNLQPLVPAEHLEKTRKTDTPQAAKGKRLAKAHEEHRRRMLAPEPKADRPKSAWPKGRRMQSRPFQKGGARS